MLNVMQLHNGQHTMYLQSTTSSFFNSRGSIFYMHIIIYSKRQPLFYGKYMYMFIILPI